MKEFLTIITPSYNRVNEIKNLYISLCNQVNKNFIWMVIDDGSDDKTDEFIIKKRNENKINISFIKKENGGKHTALNLAFEKLQTQLFMVVDSDDILTKNAVEEIHKYYIKYRNDNVKGFVFLKGYSETQSRTQNFLSEEFIGNYIIDVINKQKEGDRAEIFYTDIIQQNRFPVFKDEKFIGEGFFWNKISKKYNLVFINKIIYICQYLDNGLTKAGRKMRINNSLGGICHAMEYLNNIYSLRLRIKNMMLIIIYCKFAKKQGKKPPKIKKNWLFVLCYIPSQLLYVYWRLKYCN